MALLELIRGNLMECQKKILKISDGKADSNFAPTFFDHPLLPDINFNGHCLINNISIPNNKSIYFLHTKFMAKKCKHRLYIKELLIWICKAK